VSERLQDLASGRAEPKKRGLAAWFAGRGRRREYWLIVTPTFLIMALLGVTGLTALAYLAALGFLIALIRRLHDLGYSGWFAPVINVGCNVLAALATWLGGDVGALLGSLLYFSIVLTLGVIPGQRERNEYGPTAGKNHLAETFS